MPRFFRHLANVFVPHEGNGYQPHLMRRAGFLVALVLILLGALGAALHRHILEEGSYLAAVLPSVLVDLANSGRAERALPPLRVSETLVRAAQLKADDMAAKGYFAHISPDGTTPWHWFAEAGYQFTYAGENLAINFDDSAAVYAAWMDSPGHRANILGPQYTEIGIATAEGMYQGQPATFVVQEFGSPALPEESERASAAASTTPANLSVAETASVPEQAVVAMEPSGVAGASDTAGEPEVFMAARSVTAPSPEEVGEEASPALPPVETSTRADRLLTSPSELLTYFYLFLAILLGVAVVSVSVVEHPQRRRHLLELGALVVLIGALYALIALGVFSDLAIV